jgi:hypothetical protein
VGTEDGKREHVDIEISSFCEHVEESRKHGKGVGGAGA